MNFSEYVAILSGNTDLLDKAKLEKQIASLESERKSFNRGKSTAEAKLETIMQTVTRNDDLITRISTDLRHFGQRVQRDDQGNPLNLIELDGVKGNDPKLIAQKLAEIEDKTRTHGLSQPIGKLYGFDLLVKTESSQKNGFDFIENRFFVRGEGNILHNFNNGRLAKDPKTAAQMFLRTFETISPLLEKYQNDTEKISKDIPILQEVVKETWKKEDQLKQLKSGKQTEGEDSEHKEENRSESQSTDNAPNIAPSVAMQQAQSPSLATSSASATTPPNDKPYVHQPPDYLSTPPEKKPPHLNPPPVSFSIKDAMNSLGNKLVIGGILKPGTKDTPDTAHVPKPKGFKL